MTSPQQTELSFISQREELAPPSLRALVQLHGTIRGRLLEIIQPLEEKSAHRSGLDDSERKVLGMLKEAASRTLGPAELKARLMSPDSALPVTSQHIRELIHSKRHEPGNLAEKLAVLAGDCVYWEAWENGGLRALNTAIGNLLHELKAPGLVLNRSGIIDEMTYLIGRMIHILPFAADGLNADIEPRAPHREFPEARFLYRNFYTHFRASLPDEEISSHTCTLPLPFGSKFGSPSLGMDGSILSNSQIAFYTDHRHGPVLGVVLDARSNFDPAQQAHPQFLLDEIQSIRLVKNSAFLPRIASIQGNCQELESRGCTLEHYLNFRGFVRLRETELPGGLNDAERQKLIAGCRRAPRLPGLHVESGSYAQGKIAVDLSYAAFLDGADSRLFRVAGVKGCAADLDYAGVIAALCFGYNSAMPAHFDGHVTEVEDPLRELAAIPPYSGLQWYHSSYYREPGPANPVMNQA